MSDAADSNGRWWEGYLVRYLVGTPVGALCILAIANSALEGQRFYVGYLESAQKLFASAKFSLDPALLVALAIFSFAYCYIASSPITTFHATRMYRSTWFNRTSRYVWLGVWLFSVILLGFGSPIKLIMLVLAAPAAWTVLVQVLCVMRLHADTIGPNDLPGTKWYRNVCEAFTGKKSQEEMEFVAFYRELVDSRDKHKGLRESYTHLREHSNAIFIVLLEISLAALIITIIEFRGGDFRQNIAIALTTLFVWMLPSVFMWTQANRLERSLLG